MSILGIPNEIILEISKFLRPGDIHSLSKTNRRLSSLLSSSPFDNVFLHQSTDYGKRVLYHVCRNGDRATIKKLIDRGISEFVGNGSMLCDVGFVSVSAFKTLLECGADPVAPERALGRPPLMFAILAGRLEFMSMLLADPRADISQEDNYARTPLILAVVKSQVPAAQLLLQDPRIDPNLQDGQGCTPLHRAVEKAHDEMIKLLLEHSDVYPNIPEGYLESLIHWAAQKGHLEALQLLMADPRIHVGREDMFHWTALHWVARQGYLDLAEFLVADQRINVNIMGNHGETPLHIAAEEGHEDVVRVPLETEGIDADTTDGESIPVSALISGYIPEVAKLIEDHIVTKNNV